MPNCFFFFGQKCQLISHKEGKVKRREERSARSRPVKQAFFFFTGQNNQPYNIAGYLFFICTLLVLYFMRLNNNCTNRINSMKRPTSNKYPPSK